MRIVFLGTPEFAVSSLSAIIAAGFKVVGVVTVPDKPAGRGRKVQVSPVKEFALANKLKVLQPAHLKDELFLEELRALRADLQVVVAFRMLPEIVWNMPGLGTYNLHASLLPKYRGAAPINRAIMAGEEVTGVTTFRLRHEVDTGSLLLQEKHEIGPEMTAGELHDLLKEKGAGLMVRTLQMIETAWREGKDLSFTEQDEAGVTHAPKIFREDCRIEWTRSASQIHNHVRGLSPRPGAFTHLLQPGRKAEMLKVLRTSVSERSVDGTNGSLYAGNSGSLYVRCGNGTLEVLEVQLEGKKRMVTSEFLKGYRLPEGTALGDVPVQEA